MKKICIVTGTRAEYGLLKPVISKVEKDAELQLLLYVTGAHLSPEFGLTYHEIEEDGFAITRKIEMLLGADTPSGVIKSMGVEMIGFADALAVDRPDMMILLGDRYEILIAAAAAMVFRVPIAHIHGGERTEGLIDEAIRHSVTKMSYLHFASTEEYRRRIIQLGEHPDRVFNVGALGVESIRQIPMMDKPELEKDLNISLDGRVALVTFHPVTLTTLEMDSVKVQFTNLLKALDRFSQLTIIITKANADTDGKIINEMIDRYAECNHQRCRAFNSLGQRRYLSLLQYCKIVVGNSSSGIIEVPSFKIPTINIGTRQRGRVCAESVINCGNGVDEITEAIEKGLEEETISRLEHVTNPYEQCGTSDQIINNIKEALYRGIDIEKTFYDLEEV